MVGPSASQSFAELLEQLSKAHSRELHYLRKENIGLRCHLAVSEDTHELGGTYVDESNSAVMMSVHGDSLTVTSPIDRALLDDGLVELAGLTGSFHGGVIEWSNGVTWWKQAGGSNRTSVASGAAKDSSCLVLPEAPKQNDLSEQLTEPGGQNDAPTAPPPPRLSPPGDGRSTRSSSKEECERKSKGFAMTPSTGTGGSLAPPKGSSDKRSSTKTPQSPATTPGATTPGHPGKAPHRAVSDTVRRLAAQHAEHENVLPFAHRKSSIQSTSVSVLRWVRSPWFEGGVWVLIAASALAMALELQYQGIELGHHLKYPGSLAAEWAGADDAFFLLEWVFGILFTLCLFLKLAAYRGKFWCGPDGTWNIVDFFIVVLWWVWKADQLASDTVFPLGLNPQLLRLLRLSKMLRHVKMVRHFSTFDSLHVMTTALKGSAHVFFWACALLVTFQTIMALLLTSTIQELYLDVETTDVVKRREVYEYFGTFSRSFLSMFELTLANWPPVSRILTENISEWWMIFAILHKLTVGFALVGIINGVFMQETFKVASMDDNIMLRQKKAARKVHSRKMKALFKHLDTSGDGKLDRNEFRQIVWDQQVGDWLSAQDLTVTNADALFQLIAGEDQFITADEMITGFARLKGNVRMLDFMMLRHELVEMQADLSVQQTYNAAYMCGDNANLPQRLTL